MNYPIDIIMKMNFLKKTAAVLIVATISFAGYASTPEYTIAMTTAIAGEVEFYLAGTGTAVIDWGDGSDPETVSLSAFEEIFTNLHLCAHTFPETAARTIAIDGQGITHAACFLMYLTALDVTNDTALTYLNCGNNLLANLDVTKNTGLTFLDCGNNKLTNLDVTGNTELKGLRCYKNRLTSLDVSKNIALTALDCFDNRITSLDVSNNTGLIYLNCHDNLLTAERLNDLLGMLPSNPGSEEIYIRGNPGTADCNQSIAAEKGWTAW